MPRTLGLHALPPAAKAAATILSEASRAVKVSMADC
jgi:hypothetical protein